MSVRSEIHGEFRIYSKETEYIQDKFNPFKSKTYFISSNWKELTTQYPIHKTKTFTETYYDFIDYSLISNSMWLIKRTNVDQKNPKWILKVAHDSTKVMNPNINYLVYEELTRECDICSRIGNNFRFFALRSPVVNAYSFDKGYIFVDIGLTPFTVFI